MAAIWHLFHVYVYCHAQLGIHVFEFCSLFFYLVPTCNPRLHFGIHSHRPVSLLLLSHIRMRQWVRGKKEKSNYNHFTLFMITSPGLNFIAMWIL